MFTKLNGELNSASERLSNEIIAVCSTRSRFINVICFTIISQKLFSNNHLHKNSIRQLIFSKKQAADQISPKNCIKTERKFYGLLFVWSLSKLAAEFATECFTYSYAELSPKYLKKVIFWSFTFRPWDSTQQRYCAFNSAKFEAAQQSPMQLSL